MISYLSPKPLKAQKGYILDTTGARENARRRAIALQYFDSAPSIPNLVKGAYYWARSEPMLFGEQENPYLVTGTAPAIATPGIGAIRLVPGILGGAFGLSALLGGRSYQTAIPEARTITIDMTNSTDSTSTGLPTPRDTTSSGGSLPIPPGGEPSPPTGVQKSKEEWKDLWKAIKRVSTSPKTVIPTAIGLGTYFALKPKPDKLLKDTEGLDDAWLKWPQYTIQLPVETSNPPLKDTIYIINNDTLTKELIKERVRGIFKSKSN